MKLSNDLHPVSLASLRSISVSSTLPTDELLSLLMPTKPLKHLRNNALRTALLPLAVSSERSKVAAEKRSPKSLWNAISTSFQTV